MSNLQRFQMLLNDRCKRHHPTKRQLRRECQTHTTVRSIFTQMFHAIVHIRHTTNILQNTHAIETKPHTNTHMPPSGQSSLRSTFNAVIHMRHTTYSLQNTHAIETEPHTPPPSDVCMCLEHINDDLRPYLK